MKVSPCPLQAVEASRVMGVDTGFLVGLAVREHTAQVLDEFSHVVTDPRRFERPLAMAEALGLCEQWWNAQECARRSRSDTASRRGAGPITSLLVADIHGHVTQNIDAVQPVLAGR